MTSKCNVPTSKLTYEKSKVKWNALWEWTLIQLFIISWCIFVYVTSFYLILPVPKFFGLKILQDKDRLSGFRLNWNFACVCKLDDCVILLWHEADLMEPNVNHGDSVKKWHSPTELGLAWFNLTSAFYF